MVEPIRISPKEVRQKVSTGTAMLVCAYEDDQKFNKVHLEGAISLNDFKSKLASLAKGQEIVFYCA